MGFRCSTQQISGVSCCANQIDNVSPNSSPNGTHNADSPSCQIQAATKLNPSEELGFTGFNLLADKKPRGVFFQISLPRENACCCCSLAKDSIPRSASFLGTVGGEAG